MKEKREMLKNVIDESKLKISELVAAKKELNENLAKEREALNAAKEKLRALRTS